jgi:hypothetical protein
METMPTALTVRWISTRAPVVSWAHDGRAGGGRADGASGAQSNQVDAGQSRGQGLQMLAGQAHVHGGGIHPQRLRSPGPPRTQPKLLADTPRSPLVGTTRSSSTGSMATAASRVPTAARLSRHRWSRLRSWPRLRAHPFVDPVTTVGNVGAGASMASSGGNRSPKM